MIRCKMLGGMRIAWIWIILIMPLLLIFSGRAEAGLIYSENFNTSDGAFLVDNIGSPENPWRYDGSSTWLTDGSENLGAPSSTALNSPKIAILNAGNLFLSFDHRYSFEYDGYTRWDGGQVRISVNYGAYVPVLTFTQNGYIGTITGANVLNGQPGFNDYSAGYTSQYITSIADLGYFNAGDILSIQFLAAFDQYAKGSQPNWQIDQIQISGVPEPTTIFLLGLGLVGLAGLRRQ